MKQQENMTLTKLNQYKNLSLQASNENAHLKHAVSKHDDELEAKDACFLENKRSTWFSSSFSKRAGT